MKRNVIFLSILIMLTLTVMASEFFYTRNFKNEAESLLEKCRDYDDFELNIKKAETLVCDRKFINTLFYPKDIIQKIAPLFMRKESRGGDSQRASVLAAACAAAVRRRDDNISDSSPAPVFNNG